MIHPPPPPPEFINFSIPEFFSNTAQKGSYTKCLGTVRQNNFDGKSSFPPSFSSLTFFDTWNKWSNKGFRSFSVLGDNKFSLESRDIFYRKSWYSPPRHELFRYPKLFEWQKGSSTKWFDTVRENNFEGKCWDPPSLVRNIFRYPELMKHWRIPPQILTALWEKKCSTGNRDFLWGLKFFVTRN